MWKRTKVPELFVYLPIATSSLFRGSCIDVIKSRLRKNLKAPASSRIIPFLKGEIRRRKKNSGRLKELDQHAVFGKVIICPCYCIVFP
jgi:hypothetical protein